MGEWPYDGPRRAKLVMDELALRQQLDLRPDETIRCVQVRQDPLTVEVVFESPRLPRIPYASEAPIVSELPRAGPDEAADLG